MINDKGASLEEYIAIADEKIESFSKLLVFKESVLEEYRILLEKFHKTNSSRATTKEKGKSLEQIVKFVLEKSGGVFETYENVHTSSNEIDILARLSSRGRYFKGQGLLDFDDQFLSECKNYNKKITVTWVGKFYTLMEYTTNNLGILFSYKGLSGKNWNDAAGLVKKLHLYNKDSYIIDFNYSDFLLLADGESFVNLIRNKKFNLKNDTAIKSFLTPHPNQDKIKIDRD